MNDLLWEESDVTAPGGRRPVVAGGPAFGALLPWQRFVLATLLFLDVTGVGFLMLVILGRFQLR